MGWLSKVWKGIKKTVKKVARTVKKVSKKIVTALPGGKQLWKMGTKIGKGIMKGIGKITKALGPVGMMALSFVLGPAAGALWTSFGAGAAAMATSASTLVSTLGTLGKGIYAAGNFISGTLGAMGEALTQGASNIVKGNFSVGIKSFADNMTSAFTGEAGMAAVSEGAAAVTAFNAPKATAEFDAIAAKGRAALDPLGPDATALSSPAQHMPQASPLDATGLELTVPREANLLDKVIGTAKRTKATTDRIQGIAKDFGFGMAAGGAAGATGSGGDAGYTAEQEPYLAKAITSASGHSAGVGGGVGSSGFSLLDPIRGLKESVMASQRQLTG